MIFCASTNLHNFNDRYPWGQEAFDKAKSEDKPIFLSIGYSTCHWCHVMERESFESEEIAKLLNESFVSVKVDREERPDVDKVYMTFVQVIKMLRFEYVWYTYGDNYKLYNPFHMCKVG